MSLGSYFVIGPNGVGGGGCSTDGLGTHQLVLASLSMSSTALLGLELLRAAHALKGVVGDIFGI